MITSDLVNKIKGAIEKLRLAKDNNVKYFNFYKAINKSLIESNITNFDKDNYPALLHSLTELLRIKLTEDYTFTEHDITYNNGKFTIFVLQKIAEIIAKSQNQVEFIPQKYYKTLTELVYTLNNIEYFGYKNKMPPMVLAVYHGNIKIFESLFRIINALKNEGIPASIVGEVTSEKDGIYVFEKNRKYKLEHPRIDPFWGKFEEYLKKSI